jgi:hypothetical protein
LPRFTQEDSHLYFDLSVPERTAVDAHTVPVGVHLTLQLGYFKAKQQFFQYKPQAVSEDIRYALASVFSRQSVGASQETLVFDGPAPPKKTDAAEITIADRT